MPEDSPTTKGASQASSAHEEGLPAQQAQPAGAADTGSAELDAKTKDMLQKLSELSNSLVRDAKEDDEIFRAQHGESSD